jgi:hypothetical protein
MKPIKLESLKEMKFTVPVSLLIGLFVIGWQAKDFTIAGLDEFFVSEAEGSEMTKQIEELNENLVGYISKSEIREINNLIQEATTQITETQLWIAANGTNTIATARLGELVQRRDNLRETKVCLLDEDITDKDLCYVD